MLFCNRFIKENNVVLTTKKGLKIPKEQSAVVIPKKQSGAVIPNGQSGAVIPKEQIWSRNSKYKTIELKENNNLQNTKLTTKF